MHWYFCPYLIFRWAISNVENAHLLESRVYFWLQPFLPCVQRFEREREYINVNNLAKKLRFVGLNLYIIEQPF